IEKSEASIDWSMSAEKIHNKVRAFVMGPGTYMIVGGKKLKIHKTKVHSLEGKSSKPGEIVNENGRLLVGTGQGILELLIVQPESRNKMSGTEFLKGYQPN